MSERQVVGSVLIPADIEAETMDQTERKTVFLIQEDRVIAKPILTLLLPKGSRMTKPQLFSRSRRAYTACW